MTAFPDTSIGRYLASLPRWDGPQRNIQAAEQLEAHAAGAHPVEAADFRDAAATFRENARKLSDGR